MHINVAEFGLRNNGFRILLFAESCAAGVGRHVIDLAESLQASGHSVHLLYSRSHTDARFRSGLEQLRELGGRTAALEVRHFLHISDFRTVIQIRSYLRRFGPFDIFHCHSTKAGLLGRLAVLRTRCRCIYTPHAFMTMSASGLAVETCARGLEWALAKMTDAVICVSQEELTHALDIGVPRGKLRLVFNGIVLSEVNPLGSKRALVRQRLGIKENVVCIGFVGRLANQKAPEMLLQSYSRMLSIATSETCLVLIGDGPLRERCTAQARELGIRNRVLFETDLPGSLAMTGFDVFALSSRYEGFPYVLIEALAAGLPVVTTAVGGTSSLVKDGYNGFVLPVGDTEEYAAALNLLVSNAQLRRRMGDKSYELSKQFTLERMHDETVAAYSSVLSDLDTSRVRARECERL